MNKILILLALTITLPLPAQDITSKLGGNTANETYDVSDSNDNILFRVQGNGKVGIGTTSPTASLHVSGDDGLLVQGTFGNGVTQNLGTGTRMHFYPKKGAFRAGSVDGTLWDDANIDEYSVAMGEDTKASGGHSFAMGNSTIASGNSSTAMGEAVTASGYASTAMGGATTASGQYSTAMGHNTKAESYISTAIGRFNIGGGNPTSWVSTDPLFEIGMGANSGAKANALTVLKNGKVGIGTASPTVSSSNGIEIVGDSPAIRMRSDYDDDYAYELITTYNDPDGGGGADPDYFFAIKDINAVSDRLVISDDGDVGIGIASPVARLHVNGDDGFLAQGTFGNGTTQNLGGGTRLHFYPKKAAFRAGYVDGTQWNDANIGIYSVAMGQNTIASGGTSTAMGSSTTASGDASFAVGQITIASGRQSTAMAIIQKQTEIGQQRLVGVQQQVTTFQPRWVKVQQQVEVHQPRWVIIQ